MTAAIGRPSGLHRSIIFLVLAIFALALLSGCAGSRGGNVPYNPTNFAAPDTNVATLVEADHRLQPGDVVTVSVFQVPDVSGDREVDGLGRIQMPLIGMIDARGLTTTELSSRLTERLNESYLRDPRVQVVIKTVRTQTITVDGSVNQPGVFPIPPRFSLIQAVALARGPTQDANVKKVVVFRRIDGQRQAAAFDLSTIRDGTDPDPAIYGDDVIVVDGSSSRSVFRDILQAVPLLSVFRPF